MLSPDDCYVSLSEATEIDPKQLKNDCINKSGHNTEISIAWRNLVYEADQRRGWLPGACKQKNQNCRKQILRGLNGYFHSRTLNGLLGPSGAGKTTLLEVLSGSLQRGLTASSSIYINASAASVPISYTVAQHVEENVIGCLTVGQILRYAFLFKNGLFTANGGEARRKHIAKVLHQLMLPEAILRTRYDRCSGGEMKRVAIAQELMSLKPPAFLFVDEGTTGLDSAAAYDVIKCLKSLASNCRQSKPLTIITSIHTPNSETLKLFDKIYIMARGGVCVYSGPPKQIRAHLRDCMQGLAAQERQPIEALIKLACTDVHNQTIIDLSHQLHQTEFEQIDRQLPSLRLLPRVSTPRKAFSLVDTGLQLCRQLQIAFVANLKVFLSQVAFYVVLQLVFATVFNHKMVRPSGCYSLDPDDPHCSSSVKDNSLLNENINYHVFCFIIFGFISIASGALLFSPIIKVLTCEHRNRWYSLGSFFWSFSVVSLLESTLIALLNAALSYFLTEQHAVDEYSVNWLRLGHYVLCVWLNQVYCQSIGQLMGMLITEPSLAIVASVMGYSLLAIQNDFFFKVDEGGNPLLVAISDTLGTKYVTRYFIYIFYGIDRCDPERQYSLVLAEHLVDPRLVGYYVSRLLANIVVVRLCALLYMYFKFNPLDGGGSSLMPFLAAKSSNRKASLAPEKCLPISYITQTATGLSPELSRATAQARRKSVEEIQFGIFSANKLIIAWRDLTLYGASSIYEVGWKGGENGSSSSSKPILRNLNGQFRFGTLNALLGTSGAGKTSLLRVLNGQLKARLGTGSRFYLSQFTTISTCFITQDVSRHLIAGLTVRQMLVYASRLKNADLQEPEGGGSAEKGIITKPVMVDHEAVALSLLKELDLKSAAGTRVECLSGGERKRLALGLELTALSMPNLVCIDEPASGLDSSSAEVVVACLRKVARAHHITIVASMHQPNGELLALLDEVYVLGRGGVCLYSGPPSGIRASLKTVGPAVVGKISSTAPIETLVKHSCAGHEDAVVQQLVQNQNRKWKSDEKSASELADQTILVEDGVRQNRRRFSFTSVYLLLHRYCLLFAQRLWREYLLFVAVYLLYAGALQLYWDPAIATYSGCLDAEDDFNNSCSKTAAQAEEERAVLDSVKFSFFMSDAFLLLTMVHSTFAFLYQLPYFLNEHRNGYYSTGVFYLVRSLADTLPMVPVLALYLHLCNIYEPVRPGFYLHLFPVMLLSLLSAQAVSHIIVLLAGESVPTITILLVGSFNVILLLSNFFIKTSSLHYVYRFISNFAFPRFTLESILLLQYGFGRCTSRQIQPVLYLAELEDEHYSAGVLMLIANLLLYRLIAVLLLVRRVNPVERRQQRVSRIQEYWTKLLQTAAPGSSTLWLSTRKKAYIL